MDLSNERMQILEMIESGRITAEEGLSLLQALMSSDRDWVEAQAQPPEMSAEAVSAVNITAIGLSETAAAVNESTAEMKVFDNLPEKGDASSPSASEFPQAAGYEQSQNPEEAKDNPGEGFTDDIRKWRSWWTIPLWIGTVMTVFGGLFMYLAQQSSGIGFWFLCAAVPFTIGLVVIVLAWQSRSAPWLHLRVQQPPGKSPQRIAFSFPLPLRTASWFVRTFGWLIPGVAGQDLDRMIEAVGENASPENPLSILVEEPESGEKVEIYIG